MARRRKKIKIPTEMFTTQIERLSHEGRGIAKHNDKNVFVFAGLPRETAECQITRVKRQFTEATARHIENPHPYRIEPRCTHFGLCGGCSLQHLDTDAQIQHKETVFLEQLAHFGQLKPKHLLTPLTGDCWGYRHRARLGVKYVIKKETVLVGFRERNSGYLAQLDNCHVLHPKIGLLLTPLRDFIATLDAYQHIAQLEVAIGEDQHALVVRHLEPLSEADQQKLCQFGEKHQLSFYLQPTGPDSVTKLFPHDENFFLRYSLPKFDLSYHFHPLDFIQVNPSINQKMVKQALSLLNLRGMDTVLDLFCGLGNFTLPIAQQVKKVIGVEGSDTMVQRARMNAQKNRIENTEFYTMDLTQTIKEQPFAKQHYDKILLDPPRSGASELIPQLPALGAKIIVYISCNPATFARDAGELAKLGYTLEQAGVMDMFPHTTHVEAMGLFCFE